MNDEYRRMRNDELIERLCWVCDDIDRLQEMTQHVFIGAINMANLNSMENHIKRVKAELERRQEDTAS